MVVLLGSARKAPVTHFQYSLCRVVLMVHLAGGHTQLFHTLSVLALSSRFDGQLDLKLAAAQM